MQRGVGAGAADGTGAPSRKPNLMRPGALRSTNV
jgi:hypothetical protein